MRDAAGNQSTWTGAITIQAVSAVTVSPTQFNAAGGETTTITATGVAGLNLEARVYQGTTLMRTLPMTAADTSYTAVWDGRDDERRAGAGGQLQRSGVARRQFGALLPDERRCRCRRA